MKTTRSVLTSIVPTMVVVLLACLPLLAMVPILANSREPQPWEVQSLDIQPARVPTPPPVIDLPPVAATRARSVSAMAPAPEPIPAPMPPVMSTPDLPSPARVDAPERSTGVAIPIANWREVLAMALVCIVVLIWVSLRRAPRHHPLQKGCVS